MTDPAGIPALLDAIHHLEVRPVLWELGVGNRPWLPGAAHRQTIALGGGVASR